ncbi:MAG: hypothetical protein F9B45_30725 [Phycisphaera sp. RhM]|nr:hypothetical protein [Phycisphaera sp. RhM]
MLRRLVGIGRKFKQQRLRQSNGCKRTTANRWIGWPLLFERRPTDTEHFYCDRSSEILKPNHTLCAGGDSMTNYTIEMVPITSVQPSPENDDVYGKIEHDDQMDLLIESIRKRGLEEPIIVSDDGFIVSGHRRYFACNWLNMESIPIRRKSFSRSKLASEWAKILTEYNPQRIKKTATLLKEAMLRFSDQDATAALENFKAASIEVPAEFLEVEGVKFVPDITEKKAGFLTAAKKVIEDMRKFWPLSVRQVHYQLLNNPPLISEPKRSKFDREHYRYRNDKRSYDALIELLRQARYNGHVSMFCIDDPTRPCFETTGWSNAADFINNEIDGFLCGYHRDRQLDQPRHIEVLGEKNTLLQILRPVCREYYVTLSLGRGYGSIPTWRNMATRFKESGKEAMTLIVASDYDPEGFDLADDAVRSLRDLFGVPVDYHRVAVNDEQIKELDLASDFNPAKEESSRLASFIERTGGTDTWELESLPPEYLRDHVRAAIEANMDMDIFNQVIDQEQEDAEYLEDVRQEIAMNLGA